VNPARPTPKKPKLIRKSNNHLNGKRKRSSSYDSGEEGGSSLDEMANDRVVNKKKKTREVTENEEELPPVELPEEYQYVKASEFGSMAIYDRTADDITSATTVCSRVAMPPLFQLPITAPRPPGKTGQVKAMHMFNVPERPAEMSGWLSGIVFTLVLCFLYFCFFRNYGNTTPNH
jgi:hypothetical protein